MPEGLRIDRDLSGHVERKAENLWVETNSDVRYTDIGSDDEKIILDEMVHENWRRVVERRFRHHNPWLHKVITDRGRRLFLDVVPAKAGGRFLDVGSGWGQIALPLSRYGTVYCLDVTLGRLNILQEIARQEKAGLNYVCGNFMTFPFDREQFDLVIFNGALEWISLGAPDLGIREAQERALRKTREILSPGGVVYIGIENSLGLKYLFGAPDDHTGLRWFSFLTEADANVQYGREVGKGSLRAKTWSLEEYHSMVRGAGLDLVETYGCFPDYKIIRQIIPILGLNEMIMDGREFPLEHSGSDGSPLAFADNLGPLYRVLAQNGVAHVFCPSYGIVARRPV